MVKEKKKFDYLEIGASCFKTLACALKENVNVQGLSIEPISEYLEELKHDVGDIENDKILFLNAAVDKVSGERSLHYFDYYEFSKTHNGRLGLTGIGSFDRDNVEHEVKIQLGKDFYKFIKSRKVKCLTPAEIIEKYDIGEVDILKVDAEGYDDIIISSFLKTTSIRPKIIIYETLITDRKASKSRRDGFLTLLTKEGYDVFKFDKFNEICLPRESVFISSIDTLYTPGLKPTPKQIAQKIRSLELAGSNKRKIKKRLIRKSRGWI